MAEGFKGMIDLIDDLRRMPTQIEQEASEHVQTAADVMAAEVRNEYTIGQTGNLQKGVRIRRINAFRAQVVSTARHAYIYERGTVARKTAKGWPRGVMPKANVFIPAAIKARHHMVEQLKRIVNSQTVRGMTGRLDVVERGHD